jgi:16S rRNA G966 N2-methylase RsmD
MSQDRATPRAVIYNRQLLLGDAKRNAVLELWEVLRYGSDNYADADYVCIYGLRPADWYAVGVRLLGRTAVECTRDALGSAMGKDIATIAAKAPRTRDALVIDLFAGSGNTLYWILQQMTGAAGLGFELDPGVFELTRRNLASLRLPIRILNADYRSGLASAPLRSDQFMVAFIAPPWGDALDRIAGLDLRRTKPPIAEIIDAIFEHVRRCPLLCAIQIYETVDPQSLDELKRRFDWSAVVLYRLNAPGQNHGLLLGTNGWKP